MPFSIFCLDVLFSHNKRCLFVARRRGTYRRLSELDTAITDAFRDSAREMRDDEHIPYEKTRRLGKKWKTAFNSSSKIHNKSGVLVQVIFKKYSIVV